MNLDDTDAGWNDLRPDLDPYLLSMPGEGTGAETREETPTLLIAHSGPLSNEQLTDLLGYHRESMRAFFERYGEEGA